MQIAAEIEWKKDGFGQEQHALYLGGLCVGHIMKGMLGTYHGGEWRGWFMSDDDGNETGWYGTAEDARTSVERALFEAIKPVRDPQ